MDWYKAKEGRDFSPAEARLLPPKCSQKGILVSVFGSLRPSALQTGCL
jgi:hypothetical protein